jgi:hypothetical protein
MTDDKNRVSAEVHYYRVTLINGTSKVYPANRCDVHEGMLQLNVTNRPTFEVRVAEGMWMMVERVDGPDDGLLTYGPQADH